MGRLVNVHDIDEFVTVKRIPAAAVNSEILESVRQLDEKNELERYFRETLYDPNETPHGPTEIADILTTHVHLCGRPVLAGFVLKGKSFARVASRHVTHQFAKLRTIPTIGLMVFQAVGDIQDDAQRDFIQCALDAGCDYLILDAQETARLLIACEKICPQDGTPFGETGACQKGHTRDSGIPLVMTVREKLHYRVINLHDVSHAGAKRYTASVVLDRHYPNEIIKDIIVHVTDDMKKSCYYRSDLLKARWGATPAHVVWLYVAFDSSDVQNAHWRCRSMWIDPLLADEMRPLALGGQESHHGIEISWNRDYETFKEFYDAHQGTKEETLEGIRSFRDQLETAAERVITRFRQLQAGTIPELQFVEFMRGVAPNITDVFLKSGNLPIAHPDCVDYDNVAQGLFGTISDLALYYSDKGLITWPSPETRLQLMEWTIKRYYDDLSRVQEEEKRIK